MNIDSSREGKIPKQNNKTHSINITSMLPFFFLIPEICLKEKYTLDELDVLDILYINLYNYHDSQLCSRFILQSSTVLTFSSWNIFHHHVVLFWLMSVGSYMVQQKSPITQRSKKRAKLLVLSGKEGWHLSLSPLSIRSDTIQSCKTEFSQINSQVRFRC